MTLCIICYMIEEVRVVAAGPERVWELVSDLERWDEMLPTMQRVERLGADGPVGVGARFRVHASGLPGAVYEVTSWEPGSGFTWVASTPGVRTTATHQLQAHIGGTRLTLTIDWSGPLAGAVRRFVGSKSARMVAREADTFASLAERGAEAR